MVKGLYTAHTGMVNEMKRLDILANNLANADTTAYKKEGTTRRILRILICRRSLERLPTVYTSDRSIRIMIREVLR